MTETSLTIRVTPQLKRWLRRRYQIPSDEVFGDLADAAFEGIARQAIARGALTKAMLDTLTKGEFQMATKAVTPDRLFSSRVDVKDPSSKYSDHRYPAKHARTGLPVFDEYGREASMPSDLAKAQAGVLFKLAAKKSGISIEFSEHERELLRELTECHEWASYVGEPHENKIYAPGSVKALLDDSTSGGLEAAPISFDADLVTFPLLRGELYPIVDIKPVMRGRRIEGASMTTPTATWGGGDNVTGTLFNTASMVAAIDTTIHSVDCFVEVGRDFLSDAAVDVGSVLVELIGERFAAELDRVIAVGNGTSQPQGVINASGTVTVNADNGATGPPTVGDYESLLFGVAKQYRQPAFQPAFAANETSYQRSRGIAVSGTDQRRVFGMTHEDYQLLGRSYRIATNFTNRQIIFGCWKKYRMYRRLGVSVQWTTEGKTLVRDNLALLAVRARFGGQVIDGNAFAVMTDAQS